MKRKIALVLMLILTVALTGVLLIACESEDPAKIGELGDKIAETENVTIVSEMIVGGQVLYSSTAKLDGSKGYSAQSEGSEMSESYNEIKDGYIYYYYMDENEEWAKRGIELTPEMEATMARTNAVESIAALLKSADYEYDKDNKYFKQIETAVIEYQEMAITNATITFEEDKCIIAATIGEGADAYDMRCTISDVGTTTITLPTVAE